jgi:hypothetical protein
VAARVEGVLINVPFDRQYESLFRVLVFTIHECGFVSRCSLEAGDGSVVRMETLYRIIRQCPLGVHDLSRVALTRGLPRFNMPLELGLFLGAKRYGGRVQRQKSCVILDRDRYRYQRFCSYIAGQDIRAHGNLAAPAIAAVRDWLRAARPNKSMKGGAMIEKRFLSFWEELPRACREKGLDQRQLPFPDYRMLVAVWIETNPSSGGQGVYC